MKKSKRKNRKSGVAARSSELVLQRRRLAFYEAELKSIAYYKGQESEECKRMAAAALLTPNDELPPLENAEVSEGGTRDSRIETAAQSRPSLH